MVNAYIFQGSAPVKPTIGADGEAQQAIAEISVDLSAWSDFKHSA
jgi:hypothetical protein